MTDEEMKESLRKLNRGQRIRLELCLYYVKTREYLELHQASLFLVRLFLVLAFFTFTQLGAYHLGAIIVIGSSLSAALIWHVWVSVAWA